MHKRIAALALCLTLLSGVGGRALAAEAEPAVPVDTAPAEMQAPAEPEAPAETEAPSAPDPAAPAPAENGAPAVYVDGVLLETACAQVVGQATYVSFTALTAALRPDAAITWESGQAVARAEGLVLAARPGALYLQANDRYLYVPGGVSAGEGETLLPVRTLAQALGAGVSWDGAVQITANAAPLVSGEQFYDADAVFLLSHIIYNESGNQPMAGKIAVGNVLLNRVAHPSFPSTLYDVVYQPGQFYPEKTGCMEKTPNAESVIAAKLCLEGAVILPNAYWFNGAGKRCWASQNKQCLAVIGGHAFYG